MYPKILNNKILSKNQQISEVKRSYVIEVVALLKRGSMLHVKSFAGTRMKQIFI